MPLQLFSMFGMLVSIGALATYLGVIVYRLASAEWHQALSALWDRDILAFFLIGMVLFGLGSSANTSAASTSRCASGRATRSAPCWNGRRPKP